MFYRCEKFDAIGRLLIIKSNYINNKYAYYYLTNKFKIALEETGVPQLTKPKIYNNSIKFPSLQEQTKIAHFFSLLDKQIELWENKLQLVELTKNKMINTHINFFKNNMSCIENKKLSDISIISKGKQIDNNLLSNKGFKYLNGGRNISGYYPIYNVEEYSITISEGGESCGYVNFNNEKIWAGSHLYMIKPKECIDNKFLFFILKNMQNIIMKKRVGSGLPNIQIKCIKDLKILFPTCNYIQFKYVNLWNTLENQVYQCKNKIQLISKIKSYYLNKFFI